MVHSIMLFCFRTARIYMVSAHSNLPILLHDKCEKIFILMLIKEAIFCLQKIPRLTNTL